MDIRKLKHEIALSCKGNLKKYFNQVELLNKAIKDKDLKKNIHKSFELKK